MLSPAQLFRTILYAALFVYGFIAFFPFLWMLVNSFQSEGDTFRLPPSFVPTLILDGTPLSNYTTVWNERNFLRYFLNSTFVATMASLGQLFTCSLAGFAFGRLEFPGRRLIFIAIIGTMFVPVEVTIIPEFLLMRGLGWLDTYLPLIVPSFLVGTLGTMLMTETFRSMPKELEEAAIVDGAGLFRVYYSVMLPNAKPALAALFVIAFITNWDELLRPVLYITDPDLRTLPQGLMTFVSEFEASWKLLMTGAVISTVPLILVYLSAQRHIVQNFMGSGIKG